MNIAYFYTKFKRKFASPRQVRPYWPSNGKQSTVSRNWTHSLSQMSATLNIFENPTKYQHIQNKYGPQIPRARFSYAVFTSPSVCARESHHFYLSVHIHNQSDQYITKDRHLSRFTHLAALEVFFLNFQTVRTSGPTTEHFWDWVRNLLHGTLHAIHDVTITNM